MGGYAAGSFNLAGGTIANRIAEWNGRTWAALGSGLDQDVYALVQDGKILYAGGAFRRAGGLMANRVAKWNGSQWSMLGSGIAGTVRALARYGPYLFAGGTFERAGGFRVAANFVRWDGSGWSWPQISAKHLAAKPISALLHDGDLLYVGGQFNSIGNVTANRLACWDGTNWIRLGTGLHGGAVGAMTLHNGDLYVAGGFTMAGSTPAEHLARWDGANWHGVNTALNPRANISDLLSTKDGLYAAGNFTNIAGVKANAIAKWDGTNWSSLGEGLQASYGAFAGALVADREEIYVGGDFASAGGLPATSIARWTGSYWTNLGSGIKGGVVALAISGPNLYAGGFFTTAGDVSANHIARWDGTNWWPLGQGLSGMDFFSGVYDIEVSGTNVYVGGFFTNAGGIRANHIAKWDGFSWSPLGTGLTRIDSEFPPSSVLFHTSATSLEFFQDSLVVSGYFTHAGGKRSFNIALWNLSSSLPSAALEAEMAENHLLISWPGDFGHYQLEQTDQLFPALWRNSPNYPIQSEARQLVPTEIQQGSTFYRLQKR